MTRIILASKSPFRAQMLENAGLVFDVEPARIDERAVEEPLEASGLDGVDIAEVLALAKAQDVSARNPGAIVIGSDQTLVLDGEMLHKPEDMEAARRRLLALSGKSHKLASGAAIVQDGQTLWTHTETASVTFRNLDPAFIGRHLASVGDIALSSVGAYQIEGKGVQLFKKVSGDFFTIMGMPLMPLLDELRDRNLIDG